MSAHRTRWLSAAHPAFTLVEFLVVLVVIALLTAILLPALSSARNTARRASCLAQLRAIGVGLIEYTERNNGTLPYGFAQYSPMLDRREPWLTIARELDVDLPTAAASTSSKKSIWRCPRESALSSPDTCSYGYPPGEFMSIWLPHHRPERAVTQLFRQDPSLPILGEVAPNHATNSAQREQTVLRNSGRLAFYFDASARPW